MDRRYRAADTVKVYQSSKDGPLLDTFEQQPYSQFGFENYLYKGTMYKGYQDLWSGKVYILLDHPLRS